MKNTVIKVDGKKIVVKRSDLVIDDISSGQSRVAYQMAHWASIWASAESERIRTDAYYRKWRATVAGKILRRDPKAAEWKVRQAIESDPMFEKLKSALADAERNVILTKGIFESFRIKANALQSRGAMARAEFEAIGLSTPLKQRQKVKEFSSDSQDEKVARMRNLNKK
jgi:hypothetical protein